MSVKILEPYSILRFQHFKEWFAEACVSAGINKLSDIPLSWNARLIIGKLGLCFHLGPSSKNKLIICSSGKPNYFSWPWCYIYDIIPVVWDCWPECEATLLKFVKRNKIKTIFCTASQTADLVRRTYPDVDAVWLPEGIKITEYPKGGDLVSRKIDILELGRNMPCVHSAILKHQFYRPLRHLYQSESLVFPDNDSMIHGMQDTKISICYPQSMTHPEHAGNIETMTQRYWEFMLTGAVIAGHAPQELVDFCGYNPVVELGVNPAAQLDEILSNIATYQSLVDKNRETAERIGSWESRMDLVKEHLK